MTFKILSLDGGGIRGVLSVTILKEIEKTLEKKGHKLHKYFNLIAGTSTGSILAAGVACQMKADQLSALYEEYGKDIFLESVRRQRQSWRPSYWLRRLFTGSYALYPHERGEQGLANVLKKQLIHAELGRTPKISEITRPHLLILAYDVLSRNTTWFANNPPDGKGWYDNIEVSKICTASASAPTFFPPYELPFNDNQAIPHIDGGVSANNPELVAIAHALQIERANQLKLSDIAVLSIGAGKTTKPYRYEDIKNWGLLNWIQHLPDIFMNPGASNSEEMCRQIIENVGDSQNYLRLNFELNKQLEGEVEPGKLRNLLKEPYNEFIYKKEGKREHLSEEMDDSNLCQQLIRAAQCYVDCGEVYYKGETMPVRKAIQEFIDCVKD